MFQLDLFESHRKPHGYRRRIWVDDKRRKCKTTALADDLHRGDLHGFRLDIFKFEENDEFEINLLPSNQVVSDRGCLYFWRSSSRISVKKSCMNLKRRPCVEVQVGKNNAVYNWVIRSTLEYARKYL